MNENEINSWVSNYCGLKNFSLLNKFPHLAVHLTFMQKEWLICCNITTSLKKLDEDNIQDFFYKGIVVYVSWKSLKSYLAIMYLLDKGFLEDANIILRSMFEILVTILFIKQNPKKRALQYLEYSYVEKHRLIETITDMAGDPKNAARLREIEQEYLRIKDNYKNKSSWSGLSIREMSKKVGLEDLYNMLYRFHSQFVHTSPEAMKSYIQNIQKGFMINLEPINDNFFVGIISENCEILLQLTEIFENTFDLGRSKEIDALKNEMHTIFLKGKSNEI